MPRVTATLLGTFWDCRLRASSPTHPHTVALLLQTCLLNTSEQGKKWFVFIFKHKSFFCVFRLPGLFELTTNIRSSGSPDGSVVKNLPANAGDMGSIPGSGRPPGGGNGNPLQYSCLENPMERGARQATVHGVAKSWTRLSN